MFRGVQRRFMTIPWVGGGCQGRFRGGSRVFLVVSEGFRTRPNAGNVPKTLETPKVY